MTKIKEIKTYELAPMVYGSGKDSYRPARFIRYWVGSDVHHSSAMLQLLKRLWHWLIEA